MIFIENTTFILICYQVHNDSWKYTYHYKSHSWKQPCLYILLGSIQNEKIDTLLNKWYKKILYVERFNFLLTNLHFLVTASRAIIALKERSIASKILLWQKAWSGGWVLGRSGDWGAVYFFTSSQDIYPATLFTGQRLRGRQNQSGSFSFLRIWVELSKEKVFAFTLHTNVAPKRKMYWEENLLEAFRCKLLFWYTSEKQRLSEKVKLCHNAM